MLINFYEMINPYKEGVTMRKKVFIIIISIMVFFGVGIRLGLPAAI